MPRSPTMKLNLLLLLVGICLIVVGIFLVSSPVVVAQDDGGDVVRGGLLYDAWWVAIRGDGEEMEMGGEEGEHHHEHDDMAGAPETEQPLWKGQDPEASGGETWACSACHGFDYQGVDDTPGLLGDANMPTADIVTWLDGTKNSDHDFSMYLDETDLLDLATFISKGLIDTSTLINEDGTSTGDATHGEALFGQVCAFCHGPGGNAINFHGVDDPEFLAHVSQNEADVFIHKVRFGQPGWPMPSGINNGWTEQDAADVLAYVQTFSTEPALSGGGLLYDNWATALDVEPPEEDHPLWKGQDEELSGADTWACSACHGWDYKGSDAAPGVLDALNMPEDDIMAWLDGTKNSDHDFSMYMDETALNALVTYLHTEIHDLSPYINEDGTANGDPRFGRDLYNNTCGICHGADGRTHNFHGPDDPEYIGTISVNDPDEFFSKASFGNPEVPMPQGLALGWDVQDVADLLAYTQTLPTK